MSQSTEIEIIDRQLKALLMELATGFDPFFDVLDRTSSVNFKHHTSRRYIGVSDKVSYALAQPTASDKHLIAQMNKQALL